MIRVLKASAGSGKTYNLAREYIRLVLLGDRPDAYRHVLAVTFTNKATDEMKRRILKELYVLARNPDDSPYLNDLLREVTPDRERLQKRAQEQLSGILHDYSAFAVSTIDRFFQQTLRAFSREIGQFSTYQVQLDRDALVNESVDRVLDRLSEEDRSLLEWLTRGVREDLQQSGRFSLDGRLQEVAGSLQELPEGQAPFSREGLERLRKTCRNLVESFKQQLTDASRACLDVLQQEGVDPKDSNRSFMDQLHKYQPAQDPVKKPSDSFLAKAPYPELWFAKTKSHLRARVEGVLEAPMQAFLACFDQPYRWYVTARAIQGQLYGLGVADELRSALTQIQKEKNVLSIDDSNTILHHIIDGTDAPFIYEKLGVRYENFLLDEFQDTADIQWENFRPLLLNSESAGHDSLVVGDVKQSIYRWRGSDWELLGSRLEQEFRQVQVTRLQDNYRTCREIVSFNNAFFSYAAGELDALLGEDPAATGSISSLYRDVAQHPCFRDPAPGSVEVSFTGDQMGELLQSVQDLYAGSGHWEDIAILVRNNQEGAAIAAALVEKGIPVVSDDSLFIKTSVTVRRLVSQLSLADVPDTRAEQPSVAAYMARSMEVDVPAHYHSLVDLAEDLLQDLRTADPATFEAEIPYIQSFMDYLQDWVATGGNNLSAFLRNWKEVSPKIASPQSGDCVRIMTIHKSKGLEFPYVIVPFAEKVTLYKASPEWCRPAVEHTPLEPDADNLFRVKLEEWSADSLFSSQYARARKLAAIDNINVFYVALTRAQYGLKILAAPLPKKRDGVKDMAQLLYGFVKTDHYLRGVPYDLGTLPREEGTGSLLPATYDSYPMHSGTRLKISPEAADYFGEDGSIGPAASRRIRGNVLHGILARMDTAGELPAAVEAAIRSGELPAADREETLAFLQGRLSSAPACAWFAPGLRVFREAAVLGPDGNEYRPDRVLVQADGSVTIIDYKFGEQRESYKRQIRRYMELYRKMGYGKVSGYLWYLDENFTIFVAG